MAFNSKRFLALMEEDNEQRALFRVRPLLHEQGAFTAEELETLGDEGCLRIVPDKQEQHSFKERMRSLGTLCLVDLKQYGPEVSKIRPNKNYAPQRGETNRFVLYSDAVLALPSHSLYEVVADPRANPPLTAYYYLRHGGRIKGPYAREGDQPEGEQTSLAPDSDRLFALAIPGQRDRLLFWPREVEEEAPAEVQEPLSAIERIRLLAAENPPKLAASDEQPAEGAPEPAPLGGRLRGTPLKRSVLRQRPSGRAPQQKEPGLQDRLHAQQMQGMEAERLALLMELDRLREDRAQLMQEALQQQGEAQAAAAREADALQARLDALKPELKRLMARQPEGLALTREPAQPMSLELCAKLIMEALQKAGFVAAQDDAMHLLLMLLQEPQLRLSAAYVQDAQLAARAAAQALGILRPRGTEALQPADQAFVFVYGDMLAAEAGLPQLLCSSSRGDGFTKQERRSMQPLPEVLVAAGEGFQLGELPFGKPARRDALQRELQTSRRELPEAAVTLLEGIGQAVAAQGKPLPLSLRRALVEYLGSAQTLLQGGLSAALGRGLASYLLPFLRLHGLDAKALPQLQELPFAQAQL